jgi:hypothetical protein
MKTNLLKKGKVMINSAGIGTVTRKMVRKRAAELARLAGRSAREVSESDLATARRELTGEPELDPKQAALEAVPESKRWDPVPDRKATKFRSVPARMMTTRGEVTMRSSSKKALKRPNLTR